MVCFKPSVLYVSLLCSTLLWACVKDPQDIPPGFTSEAAFYMQGQFGNEPIIIEAGKDQWTAITDVAELDSGLVYSSFWSLDGCLTDCQPFWKFNMYQALPTSHQPTESFRHTFHTGPVDFVLADIERVGYEVKLETHPGLFMNGFSYWQDLSNPATIFSEIYTDTVFYDEHVNVCLQSISFNGCQYNQCILYDPFTGIPCLTTLQPKLVNARHLILSAIPQGTPPFQFKWFNGESGASTVVTLQDSVAGVYASVSVTDALGNLSELNQTILIHNGLVDGCYFPLNVHSTAFANSSFALAAGDLEIIHRDASGREWRSTAGVQPASSTAAILSMEYFGDSPSNHEAYTITLRLTVELTDPETNEKRMFESQQLVLPFGHR